MRASSSVVSSRAACPRQGRRSATPTARSRLGKMRAGHTASRRQGHARARRAGRAPSARRVARSPCGALAPTPEEGGGRRRARFSRRPGGGQSAHGGGGLFVRTHEAGARTSRSCASRRAARASAPSRRSTSSSRRDSSAAPAARTPSAARERRRAEPVWSKQHWSNGAGGPETRASASRLSASWRSARERTRPDISEAPALHCRTCARRIYKSNQIKYHKGHGYEVARGFVRRFLRPWPGCGGGGSIAARRGRGGLMRGACLVDRGVMRLFHRPQLPRRARGVSGVAG